MGSRVVWQIQHSGEKPKKCFGRFNKDLSHTFYRTQFSISALLKVPVLNSNAWLMVLSWRNSNMSVLCRFSKFAKVSYKRKRNVRDIFIVRENMVRQYSSREERQHITATFRNWNLKWKKISCVCSFRSLYIKLPVSNHSTMSLRISTKVSMQCKTAHKNYKTIYRHPCSYLKKLVPVFYRRNYLISFWYGKELSCSFCCLMKK